VHPSHEKLTFAHARPPQGKNEKSLITKFREKKLRKILVRKFYLDRKSLLTNFVKKKRKKFRKSFEVKFWEEFNKNL
jgi:hypothetical protein